MRGRSGLVICDPCSTVSERLGARITGAFDPVISDFTGVRVDFGGLTGPEQCAGAFFVGWFRRWLMTSWDETIWS